MSNIINHNKGAGMNVYEGTNLTVKQTYQNAMYVISYNAGDDWVTEPPVMCDTLAEAIYGVVTRHDGEFADTALSGTLPPVTVQEMWKLYEDSDTELSKSGYYDEGPTITSELQKRQARAAQDAAEALGINDLPTIPKITVRPLIPFQCVECQRVFDMTNDDEADEWMYGHDCEA
jgi:hypothetical protein